MSWLDLRLSVMTASALTLAACSGGGGGSDGGGTQNPPSQSSPMLTSPQTASVAENTAGTIYTAAASDPDDDTLTYSIAGTDVEDFAINAGTGVISFAATPDFEAPADANTDNVYALSLTVRDGNGGSDTQTLSITVTDVDTGVGERRYIDEIFSNVSAQRAITYAPGQLMDVFTPETDSATDRPLLILASGGAFTFQDRTFVEPIARRFAERGYVTATIDYTVQGIPPTTADELAVRGVRSLHDMYAAIRFMRANAEGSNTFGIRSNAILVGGESAGGIMAILAATLDTNDTIDSAAINSYLQDNGGLFGNIGANLNVSSAVNGALSLGGATLDLDYIDANSAPLFAAHFDLDNVVPCSTAPEQARNTGLIVSGSCDIVPRYGAQNAVAQSYIVESVVGHIDFSGAERDEIYAAAAQLFSDFVISEN